MISISPPSSAAPFRDWVTIVTARAAASAWLLAAMLVVIVPPAAADAQTSATRSSPAPTESMSLRGFVDVGWTTFTGADSFDAVLGSASGPVFGGGVEVILPQRIFVNIRVSRFQNDGERVFVFDDETFRLGIDTTVRVTPVEVTGGYRFHRPGWRITPYAGGGVGWHRYDETSAFADDNENVEETYRGYHVLGGAELGLWRWIHVGGEAQWTTVPDALGQDPMSVSAAFGETNLGGASFRVKVIVGR